jgi:WD40 repeat protein
MSRSRTTLLTLVAVVAPDFAFGQAAPTDLAGDPLPPGAVARLGTTRYRLRDWAARFSLYKDGSRLLWIAQDSTVTIMDVETGKATDSFKDAELPRANTSDLSPDGRFLAQSEMVRSDKGFASLLRLYDLKDRKTVWTVRPKGAELQLISAIRFTPDGRRLLTLSRPGDVRVWDAATGDELRRENIPDTAYQFQLSPDGRTIAAGYTDLYVWNWDGDTPPRKIDMGSRRSFDSIQFGPDGKTLYVSGYGGVARKGFDVATGRPTGYLDLGDQAEWFSFSPDGKTVAVGRSPNRTDAGDREGVIILRDLATGKEVRRLKADSGRPAGAQWSKDGSRMAPFSSLRVYIWDVKSGKLLGPDPPGHDGAIDTVVFAADGRVYTAGHDRTVRVWDPNTGKAHLTQLVNSDWVAGLAVSPDGSLLAGSPLSKDMLVWDAKTGQLMFRLCGHGRTGGVRKLKFSTDGQTLLSWGDDWYLRAWDTLTGKLRSEHRVLPKELTELDDEEIRMKMDLSGFETRVADLGPDGKSLVLAKGKNVHVYDSDSGKERFQFAGDPQRIDRLALSADGKLLATCGRGVESGKQPQPKGASLGDQVIVWNMADAKEVVRFRLPKESWGGVMAFTPDGRRVVTGSWDPVLHVWDAKTGALVGTIEVPHRPNAIAFDPPGKRLVVGLLDSTALVYDVASAMKPPKKE